ncbi:RNA-binding [Brachionus plicatilis]|uniref:RNA-binding region-containing protein 3 n=1 Tax=Brachionus plicatilis TaxID=10195 RepID=A0A3M7PXL2_BRAPC|nr:RNA-binding [Brachionus plicatilis]
MDGQSVIESNDYKRKLFERLCGISAKFKIPYPINHKLSYDYPKINPIICQNIISCLVKYPKFYEQTLHLMNKMNLPCPLYPYVREPCAIQIKFDSADNLEKFSSESEIESDPEISLKRKLPDKTNEHVKKIKVKSILKSMNLAPQKQENFNLNEIFEKTNKVVSHNKMKSEVKKILINSDSNFAITMPDSSNSANLTQPHAQESGSCVTNKDLESNRLKLSELEQLPIFKNYQKGNKNSRIYLKNLSKKITEEDLKLIYGRYIDWSSDEHKNAFSIRLMKEGRMKGQAFINFPDENLAEKAVDETLGYILDSKPIIAQFARSTKPS